MNEKCENLYVHNKLLSMDHAIILPYIDDCSYSRYLEEINSAVGSKHIHSIFESNGQIKIYFKDKKYVKKLLESGILLKKDYSQDFPLDFVFLNIILSRVDPAIPDNCIEEVLKTYGHLESPIVHTKVSEKSDFNHIDCGIREVKLKVFSELKFPRKLNLFCNGNFYEVDAKVIEQIPIKRTSNLIKTKKKDNYGKSKPINVLKCDSSLDCESFPEWCKNNLDDGGGTKSQNSVDLLLQVHQSQTCSPKKNYQFYNKENTTVLYEKKAKLPIIQEQQFVAFSRSSVANSSFDVSTKIHEVLKKLHQKSNHVILQNRTSIQTIQTCSDKAHVNLNCEEVRRIDLTNKRHNNFRIIPEDLSSSNVRKNRTKTVKALPSFKKIVSTKVHNTRGLLKKKVTIRSNISGKIIDPPSHMVQRNKSRREKSNLRHSGIFSPSTTLFSPKFCGKKRVFSEKQSVCDNDISPPSKSSRRRSAKEKVSSKEANVFDKNICALSNFSLLNHKTVKRKTALKSPSTYNFVCSPSNSSIPKHKTLKKKTANISDSCSNNEFSTSNAPPSKQIYQKGGTSKESDNLNIAMYSPSSTSSSRKGKAVKVKASKKSVVHSGEDLSSKFGAVEVVSSEEYSLCQPSISSSLQKTRASKRKNVAEESEAYNRPPPKSLSPIYVAVQKSKKHKGKAVICEDIHISSKSISSPNNTAAQSDVQGSDLKDCNQNVINIDKPSNQSAIPIDNLQSELVESDFSHSSIPRLISNVTDSFPSNIEIQHPTIATCDNVLSNSIQVEDDTQNIEVNFNGCDKNTEPSEIKINSKESNNENDAPDLNVEILCLPSLITAETDAQTSILSSTNSNKSDSVLLKIPNTISDQDSQKKVSSVIKDSTQNVNNHHSSETEMIDDLTKISADEAMHFNLSKEKEETLVEISPISDHKNPTPSASIRLEGHSNIKDLDFSICNTKLDSSECQSQNAVPLNISQSQYEDNQSSHIIPDIISNKTANSVPISKSNCKEPTVKSGMSNREYVNKDENNKSDLLISSDNAMNSCSNLTLSANQEKTSQHNLPNKMHDKSISNEIDSLQVVPKKNVKSKFKSRLTVNPASFLIKNRVKNKSKNNGKYPANKMMHRLQHKNSLNHQTKKQREYRNRQYLFSSTQDKSIYEYEFDSDEDYSDQVSYSKWKNQNCASKEYKKLDTNFSKRLSHSFSSYVQNKKRNKIKDVVMDENSEVHPLNNKSGSNNELRKRVKDAILPTSSKVDAINVQTAGESSTKRKRVDSSENFHSGNDYFEIVHVGDGKHEKLSIIVKKKSKLDASDKRDSINVNSDLQALEIISKNSPFDFRAETHKSNTKYMKTDCQQNIKKSKKKITSNYLIQNASPVMHSDISNLSSNNISHKTVPKYRVKSNFSSYGNRISPPKTSQGDVSISHCKFKDNSVVPEDSSLKKGIIGKSQHILPPNSNKLTNGHSSYKIVLQKISDNSSKKSSSQASHQKIIKTKYRLKSHNEEATSKTGDDKLVSKSKIGPDKNSCRNRNDLRTNELQEKATVPTTNAITDSATTALLLQNDNCDEVELHSCVSGFLQLETCSGKKKIHAIDTCRNPGKNSQKLLVNSCSQISKSNHSNELQNRASLERDLLEGNLEQNVDAVQEKNVHLIPEVTNSFLDRIDQHSTSHYAKDNDDASCNEVLAGDHPLKECCVLLERIPLPDKTSEDNTSKPLSAEGNELTRSSCSTVLFIKKEPCYPSTYDGVQSFKMVETQESCSSSLSVPNFSHDLESSIYVPSQDAVLTQANDTVVITNVISCSETGEDFSNRICEVKVPQFNDFERKVTNYSSAASLKPSEVLNGNQKLPQCVINNSSLSMDKMKSPSTFQAVNLVCNGSNSSVSTNSTGKLKKGNTKLTSIDKIAEFCALRKSAGQIPAHQLKISLLEKQDSPIINCENSSEPINLCSLPSVSIETNVDRCVKPDLIEKSSENKGNGSVQHLKQKSTICSEVSVLSSKIGCYKDVNLPIIDSSIRKEQSGQAVVALEQTQNKVRNESTFTSIFEGPCVSNVEKERSINLSNPAEVEVHELAPMQLNQMGCERNNSSVVLNRTDTYVVKSVAVSPQYIVNKNISNPDKRIYPKLYNKFPLSEKKLIAFINCMKYTKNVRHTTLQMLAKNKTPGALKDLIVQLYDFFQACNDSKIKLQISRVIMLLNEK